MAFRREAEFLNANRILQVDVMRRPVKLAQVACSGRGLNAGNRLSHGERTFCTVRANLWHPQSVLTKRSMPTRPQPLQNVTYSTPVDPKLVERVRCNRAVTKWRGESLAKFPNIPNWGLLPSPTSEQTLISGKNC